MTKDNTETGSVPELIDPSKQLDEVQEVRHGLIQKFSLNSYSRLTTVR